MKAIAFLAGLVAITAAHEDHAQAPVEGPHKGLWYNTLPGDGGTQVSTAEKTGDPHPLSNHLLTCNRRPIQSSPASQPSAASAITHVLRATKLSTISPSSVQPLSPQLHPHTSS